MLDVAARRAEVTAKTEEQENVEYFGPAYEAYIRRTRRFIPLVL